MEIIEQGYAISYNITKIGTVTPAKESEMNGQKYLPKLKIRTQNILEVEDEEVGLKDTIEVMDFFIQCKSNEDVKNLNTHIRQLKANGIVIALTGSAPVVQANWENGQRAGKKSEALKVDCYEKSDDIFKKYPLETKVTNENKHKN